MIIIYETENFYISTPDHPEISREDGGQVDIIPKVVVEDRLLFTPEMERELSYYTHVVASAFITVMRKNGVPIERINYQDNGNWCYFTGSKPHQHLHIYGRIFNSKKQPLPQSLYFPDPKSDFYKDNKPLTDNDIRDIEKEIKRLLMTKEYSKEKWMIK